MDLWVELFISYHNYTNIFQDVNVTERKAVTDLTQFILPASFPHLKKRQICV